MIVWTSVNSHVPVCVAATEQGVCRLSFSDESTFERELAADSRQAVRKDTDPFVLKIIGKLDRYFKGTLRDFQIDLDLQGTPFQLRVWEGLLTVPYGRTCSYADLAEKIGWPRHASRAVGQANNRNPVALIVPCHRVIAADGTLGGYGAGLELKERLLRLEGAAFRSTPRSLARFQVRSESQARRAGWGR
jgi:O-6-methylguanine DNA methyltransferase